MERNAAYALGAAALGAAGLLAVRQCATPVEYLDENTQSVPVVGRNIVAGSGSALLSSTVFFWVVRGVVR